MKARDAICMMERDGWWLARVRESHRVYQHPVKPGTTAGKPGAYLSQECGSVF